MTLLRRNVRRLGDRRGRSIGQGLVEFAFVLPVLLLLLMVALDFGRIYLGWVNIQNMARIGANYAANNATEFATSDPTTLAVYQKQILNDAKSNNCTLPKVGGTETAPAPTFSGYDVGDTATVQLSCTFGVITPIISNIVGNTVTVSASSQFPVKSGMVGVSDTGGGGGGGTAVSASFSCSPTTGPVILTVQCFDESGGGPDRWQWTVTGPGTFTATSGVQDPVFALTDVGAYTVTLVADNAMNKPSTFFRTSYINTGAAATADFDIQPPSGPAPLDVTFTDKSTGTPTAWAWDFTNDGTVDATTHPTASHTYTTPWTYSVKLTVTNAAGSSFVVKTVVVGAPNCTVPSLTGVRRSQADSKWTAAGFTKANLTDSPGAPNGNGWTIDFQSITAGLPVPCSSPMQVNGS